MGVGDMQLCGDCLRFCLDSGEICLKIENVDGITLIGNHIMDVYSEEKTYRVMVAHKTNILKYLHTFYIIRSRKVEAAKEFVGI